MSAGRCPICSAESTTGGHACAINITAAAWAILRTTSNRPRLDAVIDWRAAAVKMRAIAEEALILAEAAGDQSGAQAAGVIYRRTQGLRARLEDVLK